jgi:hypothetical protein
VPRCSRAVIQRVGETWDVKGHSLVMIGFDIRLSRRRQSERACHRWGWRIKHNMTGKSQGAGSPQGRWPFRDQQPETPTHTPPLIAVDLRVACLSAALRLVHFKRAWMKQPSPIKQAFRDAQSTGVELLAASCPRARTQVLAGRVVRRRQQVRGSRPYGSVGAGEATWWPLRRPSRPRPRPLRCRDW